MSFDLDTAKPAEEKKGGFDLSSAKPADGSNKEQETRWWDYIPAVPVAETALAMGSGAVVTPLAGIAGAMAGGDADTVRAIQERAIYEPRSKSGRALTHGVSLPFEMLANFADRAGGGATDLATRAGLPPEAAASIGAGTNAAIQFIPALLGKGANMVAKALPPRVVSPGLEAAGKAGLSVTPDEAGAGAIARTAAGLSGEAKLSKNISNKNQPKLVEKVVSDFELPPETVLDREVLEAVREKKGQAYEVVRKSGTVTADDAFRADLEDAVKDVRTAAGDFEHRKASPILKVVESLASKDTFDANSAVSEIKNLRKDAKKAFRAGDEELGLGSLDVARALENVLDRHIEKLATSNEYGGLQISAEAMADLKNARMIIAKSYAADKALRGTEINPQVYAKMLEDRVPLTGGALEVAEFARDFPRSSQKPSHMSIKGPDWSDLIMALASGGKSILKTAGLSTLRPAGRAVLASDVNQAILRNPDLIRGSLASPEMGAAMTAGPIVGIEHPRVDADRLIDSLKKKKSTK